MSHYEQYLYHARKFMSDYHLAFDEIENMSLEFLLDLEFVDSRVEAAFDEKHRVASKFKKGEMVFIDQIL